MLTKLNHIAIVGAQFGDEGKGALADYFAEQTDIVVRFNGGNNAGHTIVVGEKSYKFRSLPSGVIRKEKFNIIANGAIVNPVDLINEIKSHSDLTITPRQLLIASNTPLVLSLHKHLDLFREALRSQKIGTTGNGIGPAYEDKVGRRAIRAGDLLDLETHPEAKAQLAAKIKSLVDDHIHELQNFSEQNLVVENKQKDLLSAKTLFASKNKIVETLVDELEGIAPEFSPYVADATPVWKILQQADAENKKILFEGGQSILLDIDHGTYPFVTSSNTLGTSTLPGSGFSPKNGSLHVLGVAKAYVTRVGNGPFPSKIEGDLATKIQTLGHEYGTVTGRLRDVGWIDLVALKKATAVGGIHSLALTKVDILDGLETIKLVTEYSLDGQRIDDIPTQEWKWKHLTPVFKTIPGWKNSTKKRSDLPRELMNFIQMIEDHVQVKISIVTTGPERDDKVILDREVFGV